MRLRYIISEMGVGLRRNISMTISVIIVTFFSLTFVGTALLMRAEVRQIEKDWYGRIEITIFLCPVDSLEPTCAAGPVTEEQKADILAALGAPEVAPLVKEVYFESQAEAFASFQARFGDEAWASQITADDWFSTYRIKLADPQQYEAVADVVTGRPGVERVEDYRDKLKSVYDTLDKAKWLTFGFAILMLVAAGLLIATTIRLSLLFRRREIGIMRLVGASNWLVQAPFLLEGALAATVGAVLSVGVLWLGVRKVVTGWLARNVNSVQFITTADVWAIAPLLVGGAVVLAVVSSLFNLNRYTKV
ncbi:MAG: permease-like cell division protein FtsX [Micrococcales bacterium]|nr:permease-like cell division protein FtsX [Micrococcales bacterium]